MLSSSINKNLKIAFKSSKKAFHPHLSTDSFGNDKKLSNYDLNLVERMIEDSTLTNFAHAWSGW